MAVYFNNERQKWHAKLYYEGVNHHLGYFINKETAELIVEEERKALAKMKTVQFKNNAKMGNIKVEHKTAWDRKSEASLKAITSSGKYTYVKPGARPSSFYMNY